MTKQQYSPEQKVLSFIRDNRLVTGGEKIVVAVSGGPDSVCLLHILYRLRRELGIKLHIAHLDPQLRGAESDAAAAYVARLAKRFKIPATIASRDVQAYRVKHKISLEEAAREVRYAFLAEVVNKTGAAKVAVGHTSSDHIETVLMHLIRGSGTKGLRGLLPAARQKISGETLNVIRPLLQLTREDTTAYCKAHKLEPREDSTNLSLKPFRNKVRLKLLPELRKYNPQIAYALLKTATTAAVDLDFIEQEARRIHEKITTVEKGSVAIDKKTFMALHTALQKQVLRFSIESVLGSLKDIESGHIEEILNALEKPAGKVIGLPFGLNFYIDYDKYILALESAPFCPLPALESEFALNVPGKTKSSGWVVAASVVQPSAALIKKTGEGFTACFDAAAAGKKLTVRRRLPGDRFQPLGMEQEKKLNRFMIDSRVPRAWRGRVPIVCAGGRIIWAAGWRIDERYRVKPDTKKVLKLEFTRI